MQAEQGKQKEHSPDINIKTRSVGSYLCTSPDI